MENPVFLVGQLYLLPVADDGMSHDVNDEPVYNYLVRRIVRGALETRFNALDEHGRAERLCYKIVRAALKAFELVKFFAACREENDRNIGGLAYFAADLPAVHLRHHYIKHRQSYIAVFRENAQSLRTVLRLDRLEALGGKEIPDNTAYLRLIVRDKYLLQKLPSLWRRLTPHPKIIYN